MTTLTPEDRFARLMERAQLRSSIGTRTVRSGAYAMGAEAIEFVLRLGSIFILARMLTPEHFGLIAMVTAITSIAERFKDLGLSIATIQQPEISHAQVSALFWVNAAVGLVLMLLIGGLSWPIAGFFDEERLVPVTMVIATTFFFGGIVVQHQALLRRQMLYGRIALIQICSSAASVVVAVAMAWADHGYWALVGREVSRALFLAIGTWWSMPFVPGRPKRGARIGSMLKIGGDVTGFNLVNFLTQNLDQIVIGKIAGATALGFYRQGVTLVLAPFTQLTGPVNAVSESALSRLQNDPVAFRRSYRKILAALSMATMPMAAFLAVFSEPVVAAALGDNWMAAAEFVWILAVASFIRPSMSTIGAVMISRGLSRRYLVLWGIAPCSLLVVLILVGSQWGATGVAYAHLFYSYLFLLPSLAIGLKGSPISPRDFLASTWRPAAAAIVMAGTLALLQATFPDPEHPFIALSWAIPLGAALYLGVLWALPGGRQELTELLERVRRRD